MDSGGEETATLLRVGTFNVHGWTDGNHEDNFERVVDLIGTYYAYSKSGLLLFHHYLLNSRRIKLKIFSKLNAVL